jgi:acetyltransferase-like isoleucine patch superfamily enzyme
LITSGVKISSSIQVGAGAVVSKSISEKGVYVSQGLRVLPLPPEPDQRLDLKLDEDNNEDRIFIKTI